jgi:hypothetical protein
MPRPDCCEAAGLLGRSIIGGYGNRALNVGVVADMSIKTRKPVTASERMRLLRARRRNGLRCVIVMLHETEIDRLMEKGFLAPERRRDHFAIENAIGNFICYALGPQEEARGP